MRPSVVSAIGMDLVSQLGHPALQLSLGKMDTHSTYHGTGRAAVQVQEVGSRDTGCWCAGVRQGHPSSKHFVPGAQRELGKSFCNRKE